LLLDAADRGDAPGDREANTIGGDTDLVPPIGMQAKHAYRCSG
jgi:hypothetical protein